MSPMSRSSCSTNPLLPQAAATRAAQAATAVRAIFLLLRKSNETTSFVGLTCVHKWDVTALVRFGRRPGGRCQVNRRLREMNMAINIPPSALKYS